MEEIKMPDPKNNTTGTSVARLPLLLALAGRVPLIIARWIGSGLGALVWVLSPGYRKKMHRNLAIAGLDTYKMRFRAVSEAGRMVAECPYIWSRTPRMISRQILMNCSPEHAAQIKAAEASGKGLLILTPHLGAFEVVARYYAAHRPMTVLFKPAKIRVFNEWLVAARTVEGIEPMPPTVGGLRQIVRALRRGEVVGLVPDQVPTQGDGEWAPFFGQPAYTMTLPQRLVEMTGCAVILCAGERLRAGAGWRMHFEPMDELPTPARVNARFERLIRYIPGQYLWGYNRYKRPVGVAPANESGSGLRQRGDGVGLSDAETSDRYLNGPTRSANIVPPAPGTARQ